MCQQRQAVDDAAVSLRTSGHDRGLGESSQRSDRGLAVTGICGGADEGGVVDVSPPLGDFVGMFDKESLEAAITRGSACHRGRRIVKRRKPSDPGN